MSNIIVRNVVGTGVFAIPTDDTELYSAGTALQGILNGIPSFQYKTALAQIVDSPPVAQELTLVIDEFTYIGTWVPADIDALRSAIAAALLSDAEIDTIGDIDINVVEVVPLYTYVPQVDHIDNHLGMIYFKNQVPPGAQIEVYRYARKLRGQEHGENVYVRLGKRWRPDSLIAVGELYWNAGAHQRSGHGRTHFRFAYRWPAYPGTLAPAPGIRGPLSAFTISTSNPWERGEGSLLCIVASPSGYHYNYS